MVVSVTANTSPNPRFLSWALVGPTYAMHEMDPTLANSIMPSPLLLVQGSSVHLGEVPSTADKGYDVASFADLPKIRPMRSRQRGTWPKATQILLLVGDHDCAEVAVAFGIWVRAQNTIPIRVEPTT